MLVVACPCALILATPAAVIAALGRLAGTGILIKGGSALERLAQVDSFAFDKTGTLTEGRLELGDVVGLNGASAEEVLRAAATAEQRSEHVLGRLIVQQAAARGWTPDTVEDFQPIPAPASRPAPARTRWSSARRGFSRNRGLRCRRRSRRCWRSSIPAARRRCWWRVPAWSSASSGARSGAAGGESRTR